MNLKDYISNDIEELTLSSTVESAQKIFKDFPITHIPVVEEKQLMGCISETDISTIENESALLSEYSYLMDHFSVEENITLLDLITNFADHDCNVMPTHNKEREYVGYYELNDILDIFSDSPFLHTNGVEIVIEKSEKDYSSSQITQIVESNGGKVLGFYISNQTADAVQVTVKVSSEDINEIIQTFRRYNYNIISQYKDDHYLQDLKDRSDYLQKYLDM